MHSGFASARCSSSMHHDAARARAWAHSNGIVFKHAGGARPREALAVARRDRPDLIVSKDSIPAMDGVGLCAALPPRCAIAKMPILVISERRRKSSVAARCRRARRLPDQTGEIRLARGPEYAPAARRCSSSSSRTRTPQLVASSTLSNRSCRPRSTTRGMPC